MQDVKAAGAVLFTLRDKVPHYLILRSIYHGEWGPPKGHADEGESELETALREIFEETGIRKAQFVPGFRETLAYNVEKKGKRVQKEVIYFLSEMVTEDVELSDEHSEAHLAPFSEIEELVRHDDLKSIFRKAESFIRASGRCK